MKPLPLIWTPQDIIHNGPLHGILIVLEDILQDPPQSVLIMFEYILGNQRQGIGQPFLSVLGDLVGANELII